MIIFGRSRFVLLLCLLALLGTAYVRLAYIAACITSLLTLWTVSIDGPRQTSPRLEHVRVLGFRSGASNPPFAGASWRH